MNNSGRKRSVGAILGGLWLALALAAPATAAPRSGTSAGITKTKSGENVVDTIIVRGRLYKPQVFVFLGRKRLDLDWDHADARFRRGFLERITRSVWSKPF